MSHLDIYKDVSATSEVMGSTPWQEVKLLLEKLDQNIGVALCSIDAQDIPTKCKKLTNANDITMYLYDCINTEANSEVGKKLTGIYKHLQELIFWANAKNDVVKLAEAKKITENLCQWWNKVNA